MHSSHPELKLATDGRERTNHDDTSAPPYMQAGEGDWAIVLRSPDPLPNISP